MQYSDSYENSQNYSPQFAKYMEDLAARLFSRYPLREWRIAEVGCGKGSFLRILRKLGARSVTGFDPSFLGKAPEGVRVVKDYFGPKYRGETFDFVVCRHVLEHICDPAGFVRSIAATLKKEDTCLYFEIPISAGYMRAAPSTTSSTSIATTSPNRR